MANCPQGDNKRLLLKRNYCEQYFREMAITYSIITPNYITLMGLSESINAMHC